MKRYLIIVAVLGMVAGCQNPTVQEAKIQAEKRWSHTRAQMLYGVAQEHYRVGQLDKAQGKSLEALTLDPEYTDVHILMGKLYIEQGNYVSANASLQKAVALDPKRSESFYLLAVAQEKDGQLEDSLLNYRKARELDPNNLDPVMASAEVLILLNRPQEARLYVESFMSQAGNEPGMYEMAGRLATMDKDFAAAANYYQQAADLDNKNFRYRESLADSQYRAGKYSDAAETFTDLFAMEGYKPTVSRYNRLGDCYMAMEKPVAAREAYFKANEMDGQSLAAWVNLAKASLALGDPQRAVLCARSAMSIDANHLDAAMILGFALLQQGQNQAAASVLARAAQAHPDSGMVQCLLGRAYAAAGQAEQASHCYSLAFQLEPNNPLVRELNVRRRAGTN